MSYIVLFAITAFLIHKLSVKKPLISKQVIKKKIDHLPDQFVVFDLETTGLDPTKHEIIEIGAIKVNKNSNHHEGFQYLIKPKKKISSKITGINGITNEMVQSEGRELSEVLPEFMEFIGNHHLIAYNASFDMGFIQAAANHHGIAIHNPHSCALKMARRAWPNLPSYKLGFIAENAGLSTTGSHRALKDCELTATVYMAAAAKLKGMR
jgi:DNA polymerase III epsilon subunit family exonuclease